MDASSNPYFTIFGKNPEHVLELLRQRRTNGKKDDGRKFGLIIEGGGMRSIIAGGMLLAIHEHADTKLFDVIYGTSAGALGGAFFLSGQSPYGIGIYYEDLATARFINLARIPPKFDIDFLIDVLEHKRKLDTDAVKRHPTELVIAATDVDTGKRRFISSRSEIPLLTAIKASCALPVFYGKPVEINGSRCLDGGAINDQLVQKAIDDGCTDILMLFTHPRERRLKRFKLRMFIEAYELKKYSPRFAEAFFNRDQAYEQALRCIEETKRARIAVIAPRKQTLTVSTINKKRLKRAYFASRQFMRAILEAR